MLSREGDQRACEVYSLTFQAEGSLTTTTFYDLRRHIIGLGEGWNNKLGEKKPIQARLKHWNTVNKAEILQELFQSIRYIFFFIFTMSLF